MPLVLQPTSTVDASPALGAAAAKDPNKEKTWDGFKKFNEIPVDPTKQIPTTPQLSNDQILREKLKNIKKIRSIGKERYSTDEKIQLWIVH